jgi:hypothetical protein
LSTSTSCIERHQEFRVGGLYIIDSLPHDRSLNSKFAAQLFSENRPGNELSVAQIEFPECKRLSSRMNL